MAQVILQQRFKVPVLYLGLGVTDRTNDQCCLRWWGREQKNMERPGYNQLHKGKKTNFRGAQPRKAKPFWICFMQVSGGGSGKEKKQDIRTEYGQKAAHFEITKIKSFHTHTRHTWPLEAGSTKGRQQWTMETRGWGWAMFSTLSLLYNTADKMLKAGNLTRIKSQNCVSGRCLYATIPGSG